MVDTLTPVLSDAWDTDRPWTLESYEQAGGYAALDTALGMPGQATASSTNRPVSSTATADGSVE